MLNMFGENSVVIVAILCYTAYQIVALQRGSRSRREKYEELKLLNELREKGVISQEDFDAKKTELLKD